MRQGCIASRNALHMSGHVPVRTGGKCIHVDRRSDQLLSMAQGKSAFMSTAALISYGLYSGSCGYGLCSNGLCSHGLYSCGLELWHRGRVRSCRPPLSSARRGDCAHVGTHVDMHAYVHVDTHGDAHIHAHGVRTSTPTACLYTCLYRSLCTCPQTCLLRLVRLHTCLDTRPNTHV